MKRLLCMFCALTVLLVCVACADQDTPSTADTSVGAEQNASSTTDSPASTTPANSFTLISPYTNREITFMLVEPSAKGTPNAERVNNTDINKDYVAEFMELLGEDTELSGLLSGYALDEAHCYNVTPSTFAGETDMKIFKFSDSCASFVLLDGEIYQLCEFCGGYGFVDARLWDFDCDGTLDLLVSSSWGSGMHRSILSVFNPVTKESTIIFDSSTTATPNVDVVAVSSVPASGTTGSIWRCTLRIYTIDLTVNDLENCGLANLSWTYNEEIGYIYPDNGEPAFVPWE